MIVAARTVPDQRYGIGLFLVEAGMEGFGRGKRLHKMGMAAQDTSELYFDNVKVPKQNVLGAAWGWEMIVLFHPIDAAIVARISMPG